MNKKKLASEYIASTPALSPDDPAKEVSVLPAGLPVPIDDGAADHLVGLPVPSIALQAGTTGPVNLAEITGRTVVYAFPMSGLDDSILPDNWDEIPGARGCTPHHCNMRDHHRDLAELGVGVFGLATQSAEYLQGEVDRLRLPYELLSDEDLGFADAAGLPRFDVKIGGTTVLKRITLIVNDGVIEHVFYPVFPPDEAASQVIEWLRAMNR